MKKSRWVVAVFAIGILAFAFFCGGNNKVKPLKANETAAIADIAKEAASENSNNEVNSDTNKDKTAISEQKKDSEVKNTDKQGNKDPKKTSKTESKTAKESTTSKKDKYQTDPVPAGKPKPVEPQDVKVNKDKKLTCTLSVTCKTILNNMDMFNKDKLEVLPKDGVIYITQEVEFYDGESVFDVLLREMEKNKIHMEFEMTPIYNSNYIEGIHNLYEFDCGELSGWMYRVNGWFPNYGCSRYKLKAGDKIEWIYTCDLGRDIGGGYAVGGEE